MLGLLATQNTGAILGPIAKLLGVVMNAIFNLMDSLFGIQNIGLSIILFTIVVYMCMLPLTYKQQKFSKMNAKMNICIFIRYIHIFMQIYLKILVKNLNIFSKKA